jgi:hypothetical protein
MPQRAPEADASSVSLLITIFAILIALTDPAQLSASPLFLPAVTYDSGGTFAISVAVADVNGDGQSDLVVANVFSTSVGVLLGNGDGTFQPASSYSSGGHFTQSVAVADVNGDAKPDVLAAVRCLNSEDCSGSVRVLLGNGDGTFELAASYDSGGQTAWFVKLEDVNGDGRSDAVVANDDSNTVGVLLNAVDTTPPLITLSANPKVLWPPTGRMMPVTVSGTITDTGSGVSVNSATYAVNDEYGEVQPAGAITVGPGGNFSFTILLQASRRDADRDGRRYTVTVRAKDNAGNGGSKTSVVTVPHDQGR